jgi:ATP-dependent Clp protease ATP-binding subunit ClpA
VVEKQIDELRAMIAERRVSLVVTDAARAWLAAKGFDRAFGARPMARLIERVIKLPLSERLLFGALPQAGGVVTVDVVSGEIALDVVPLAEERA